MFQLGRVGDFVAVVPLTDKSMLLKDRLNYLHLRQLVIPKDFSQPLPDLTHLVLGRMTANIFTDREIKNYFKLNSLTEAIDLFNNTLPYCTRVRCLDKYLKYNYPIKDLAHWHYLSHNIAIGDGYGAQMSIEDIYDIYNCVRFAQATYSLDEFNVVREQARQLGFDIVRSVDPATLPSGELRRVQGWYSHTDFQMLTYGVPLLVVWNLVIHGEGVLHNTEDIPHYLYPYILENGRDSDVYRDLAKDQHLARYYR